MFWEPEGGQSLKNAEGVGGQSWKNAKTPLEQKGGHPLTIVEFAYNNAPDATTGLLPFYPNKGYYPNLSIHPEQDVASTQAQDYVVNLNELH